MSYSYYPAGMSYEDLIYVGEIDDPNAPKTWFEEAVNDEGADHINHLWKRFCEACDDDRYWFDAEGAEEFILDLYPEYWSGYEPPKKAA